MAQRKYRWRCAATAHGTHLSPRIDWGPTTAPALAGDGTTVADPKGRRAPGYERHVFICGHERPPDATRPCCSGRDSLAVLKQMKTAASEAGLSGVRVQKSGCLDFCENGISCVVYPEGVWYRITEPKRDVAEIVERHLLHGEVVKRCLMEF